MFRRFFIMSTLLSLGVTAQAETIQLNPDDLVRAGPFGWLATGLELPAPSHDAQVIGQNADGNAALLLRRLSHQGVASGLGGVLYDNRDRGHSTLPPELFPDLTHVTYAPALREAGLDYGLAGELLFPAVTLGNSSTAVSDPSVERSLPRLAMTVPMSPAQSFRAYASNQIYVYPEHRDHDAEDLFPANWPYSVISQGSSGSDQAFLQALLMTLAAFRPDTRAWLEDEGLIAPTLQMILRRTQKGSYTAEAYRTGAAHPTVFDAQNLSPGRMIGLAASIAPEDIPPMVRLNVVSEDFRATAGLADLSERLFDTPSAIARIWRGPEYERSITLSAANTRDPNGRDLEFHWVLLRGDPDKVSITPTEEGLSAEISLSWHDPFPIPSATRGTANLTSRVDIGVIAWNGAQFSAPAFLSVSFPTHHQRVYTPGLEGQMRLSSVDYDAQARNAAYDPMLHWSAPWRDVMRYDENNDLAGWLRDTADNTSLEMTTKEETVDDISVQYGVQETPAGPRLVMSSESE